MTGRIADRTDRDGAGGRDHDDDRDRDVDVERPAPAQVVGEQPAEQRPDHGGDAEDRADRALVLAALAQRDHVGDQRHRGDHQPAGADALHRRARRSAASCSWPGRTGTSRVMKTIAEIWKISLRPNRSPNLPTSTVATVSASRYDGDHPGHVPGAAEVRDDRRAARCRRWSGRGPPAACRA